MLKNSEDELKQLIQRNKQGFIEQFLTIRSKQREVVPFILNPIQAHMAAHRTNSDIFVKPRQVGASEYFIADVSIETFFVPGTTTIIVAYEEEATKRLLTKADYFYNHLLTGELSEYLPTRNHDSEYKKTFHWYKDKDNPKAGQIHPPSTLYIASARSFVIARGDAYHNIIADEFAYWPNPEKLVELLGGRTPGSRLVILSTPNGEDNQFCEMYQVSKQKELTGDNVYKAHFYPWFAHPEYALSVDNPDTLERDRVSPLTDLDSDELSLMDKGITEQQIRWRRFKVAEMEQMRELGETRTFFSQEFPEDDQTCFLSFGDMAYSAEILNEKLRTCVPPKKHLLFADIWYEPEEQGKYLVSVDPGLARQSMTAITVWQFFVDNDGHDVAKHCATIHGLYEPERTKTLVWDIAKHYNWATVAPENNLGTLAILLKDYPNKYLLKDPISGRPTMIFGWYTNGKTKPIMVNELQMMLPRMIIHDARIIKEIRNMRIDPTREERVISTGLDDLHDSTCIAMMCRPRRRVNTGFAFNYGRRK